MLKEGTMAKARLWYSDNAGGFFPREELKRELEPLEDGEATTDQWLGWALEVNDPSPSLISSAT